MEMGSLREHINLLGLMDNDPRVEMRSRAEQSKQKSVQGLGRETGLALGLVDVWPAIWRGCSKTEVDPWAPRSTVYGIQVGWRLIDK